MPSYYAIIVAGGSGSRMQSATPKQFLILLGKPVLMHTIQAFYYSSFKPFIILVLGNDQINYWRNLCNEYNFDIPHQIVEGGEERFYSVKNGLGIVQKDSVVAIHDAVRPLASDALITKCFTEAESKGAAVCAVPSKDSVRQVKDDKSVALERGSVYLVQTPQTFKYEILKNAYNQPYQSLFTDDASVVEKAGNSIQIVAGEYSNIKITFPEDLLVAEVLLNKKIRP